MSDFWKREWESDAKPPIVIGRGPRPELLRMLDGSANYPVHPAAKHPPCFKEGVFRHVVTGPDFLVMAPGHLRNTAAELQEYVGRFTLYFLCTRPSIRVAHVEHAEGEVSYSFFRVLDTGEREEWTQSQPEPDWLASCSIDENDDRVLLVDTNDGQTFRNDASLVSQSLSQGDSATRFDLRVRYIGRARGLVDESCALDRLQQHRKYQELIEEMMSSTHRNADVWVVLGSGTTISMVSGEEGDGPGNYSEPVKDREIEREMRLRSQLKERHRIDLNEALLINYFKPDLNEQHVGDLKLSSKVVRAFSQVGVTGAVICLWTDSLGVTLYSEATERTQLHAKRFCL